jgi:hypothetical protein
MPKTSHFFSFHELNLFIQEHSIKLYNLASKIFHDKIKKHPIRPNFDRTFEIYKEKLDLYYVQFYPSWDDWVKWLKQIRKDVVAHWIATYTTWLEEERG